jgi:hypothetical protein
MDERERQVAANTVMMIMVYFLFLHIFVFFLIFWHIVLRTLHIYLGHVRVKLRELKSFKAQLAECD